MNNGQPSVFVEVNQPEDVVNQWVTHAIDGEPQVVHVSGADCEGVTLVLHLMTVRSKRAMLPIMVGARVELASAEQVTEWINDHSEFTQQDRRADSNWLAALIVLASVPAGALLDWFTGAPGAFVLIAGGGGLVSATLFSALRAQTVRQDVIAELAQRYRGALRSHAVALHRREQEVAADFSPVLFGGRTESGTIPLFTS